jgi:hypothetical protein
LNSAPEEDPQYLSIDLVDDWLKGVSTMPHLILAVMALWLSCVFVLQSCDNEGSQKTRNQLVAIQQENSTLRQQLNDLRDHCRDVQSKHENLTIAHEELKQWSRELMVILGPSLWSPGTYERPFPIKFYKTASAPQLAAELNHHFQSIKLPQFTLLGIQGNLAVVQVQEGARLTETMGTTGAQGYLGAVAYTLCSLKHIDCVDFRFEPGSHAVPGRYCR